MSFVNGSLVEAIDRFHIPNQSEVASLIIDEKKVWSKKEFGQYAETEELASTRRISQMHVLREMQKLGCRKVVVNFPGHDVTYHDKDMHDTYIRYHPSLPDFVFFKNTFNVLADCQSKELLNYFESQNIHTLVIMGGNIDCCVHGSLVGGKVFHSCSVGYSPGLLTLGYTAISCPKILAPYNDKMYSHIGQKFSPEAVRYSEQTETEAYALYTHLLAKKEGVFPKFLLSKGVRLYSNL